MQEHAEPEPREQGSPTSTRPAAGGGRATPCGRCAALMLLAAAVLAACGPAQSGDSDTPLDPGDGPLAVFDPTLATKKGNAAATWLAFPYPSDHRRTARGTIALSDFPSGTQISLLSSYIELAEAELDGFGASSGVHVTFDTPLDPDSIPREPGAFLAAGSPLQLVDVTEGSPEYGRRRPLRWEWRGKTGRFVWQNSLAVGPAWGFPLRERTTYALVVTTAVQGANGSPVRQHPLVGGLLAGQAAPPAARPEVPQATWDDLLARWAPLRKLLAREGIATSSVAVATVFTTQTITGQLAAIHQQIASELPAPPLRGDAWRTPDSAAPESYFRDANFTWKTGASVNYWIMEGVFDSPNYQQGEVPYASQGGALNFVDGKPAPVRSEPLRFVLTFPSAPPAGKCYPLVEVAHGTGGDAYSFYRDRTAGRLAARGLAGIGLDQPLHGPRGEGKTFEVDLMSFNYLNPASARANFRQSAIDTFSLTRFAKESLKVPASRSPTGQEICFETSRVGFFGHSHGGLSGAIAAAYERGISAWLLSGAGGGLGVTVMERKDVMDVKAAVEMALGLAEGEALTDLHPAMTLIQTLVEVTDPINYAPYWATLPTYGAPQSLVLTSGHHDVQTPYMTATHLALAGRLPLVAPVALPIPQYALLGMAPVAAPLSGNVSGATQGFLQWTDDLGKSNYDTHYVVFYRPEAIHASMRFLESSAFGGTPVLERNPSADVR